MRVAAVALVLIVGAAVVLAFANTLNSWVLGGLLGGLAALLLSIPISLALFTVLARRHDVRRRPVDGFYEDEPEFAEDGYNGQVVYEAEGYITFEDDQFSNARQTRYSLDDSRPSTSGLLRLPPVGQSRASYEDRIAPGASGQLRNYPLQPRYPARNLARDTASQLPKNSQRPTQGGARRNLSTRSLAQHRSEALRRARQEAQNQQAGDRPGTRTRHSQEVRSRFVPRSRSSQHLSYSPGAQRPLDDDMPPGRPQRTQFAWHEEETFVDDSTTNQLYDSSQHYPRRPSYPRQPRARRTRAQAQADRWRTSEMDENDQDSLHERQVRRDADRMSGSLRNPLVRRAPYLYDDDPLREEFAQQIDSERPIIRRSSLYERYQDDEEY